MKQTLKKAMSILLAFTLLFGSLAFGFSDVDWADFTVKANAEEAGTYSGKCGKNLTWTLDTKTGEFTISGAGDMYSWDFWSDAPWDSYRSDIKSVTIGNGVTDIGQLAFLDCDNLTSITVDSANEYYSNDEYGVLFNKNKTALVQYPAGNSRTSYVIPDSVVYICHGAFNGCANLTSIEIPDSVVIIYDTAFGGCTSLTNVTIPDSVTSIGNGVFEDCYNLKSVAIGNSVTSIGYSAFAECSSLSSVTIGNSVTHIGMDAFAVCTSLTNVTIPDSVIDIDDYAFLSCTSLTSVTIPDSVTSIGYAAFYACDSLTDIYYNGTEKQWKAVSIGSENDSLLNATIHYNYVPKDEPVTEPTTQPEETTTVPTTTEPSTTKPAVTEPSTTKPVVTTKPATTKPVEIPTTTKPVETTKPSTTKPVETTKPATTKPEPIEEEIIKKPSTSEVKYGETLILHADFENVPDGAKIEWSVEGNGVTIAPSADGKTCAVTSTATGDVTITAKYVDANGVEHISEQEIKSNASFWQKIVSFFKNLFGINRVIAQTIKF